MFLQMTFHDSDFFCKLFNLRGEKDCLFEYGNDTRKITVNAFRRPKLITETKKKHVLILDADK